MKLCIRLLCFALLSLVLVASEQQQPVINATENDGAQAKRSQKTAEQREEDDQRIAKLVAKMLVDDEMFERVIDKFAEDIAEKLSSTLTDKVIEKLNATQHDLVFGEDTESSSPPETKDEIKRDGVCPEFKDFVTMYHGKHTCQELYMYSACEMTLEQLLEEYNTKHATKLIEDKLNCDHLTIYQHGLTTACKQGLTVKQMYVTKCHDKQRFVDHKPYKPPEAETSTDKTEL